MTDEQWTTLKAIAPFLAMGCVLLSCGVAAATSVLIAQYNASNAKALAVWNAQRSDAAEDLRPILSKVDEVIHALESLNEVDIIDNECVTDDGAYGRGAFYSAAHSLITNASRGVITQRGISGTDATQLGMILLDLGLFAVALEEYASRRFPESEVDQVETRSGPPFNPAPGDTDMTALSRLVEYKQRTMRSMQRAREIIARVPYNRLP